MGPAAFANAIASTRADIDAEPYWGGPDDFASAHEALDRIAARVADLFAAASPDFDRSAFLRTAGNSEA